MTVEGNLGAKKDRPALAAHGLPTLLGTGKDGRATTTQITRVTSLSHSHIVSITHIQPPNRPMPGLAHRINGSGKGADMVEDRAQRTSIHNNSYPGGNSVACVVVMDSEDSYRLHWSVSLWCP